MIAAMISQMAKRIVVKSDSHERPSACMGSEARQVLSHAVEGHESETMMKVACYLSGGLKTQLYLHWNLEHKN